MTNGAPTGSPNAEPVHVNALLRHKIMVSGAELVRVRKPRPVLPSCRCPRRPGVTASTFVARFLCECGRAWEWHPETGWAERAL